MQVRSLLLILLTLTAAALQGCHSTGGCGKGCVPCAGWCSWDAFVSNCGSKKCLPKPYATFGKYWPTGDKHATEKAARNCAAHALHELKKQYGEKPPSDYADGFEQAFVDVASGGNGVTPPIPPSQYWNAHYRTAQGRGHAQMWFDGYRDGVTAAQQYGIFDNRAVAVSADGAWAAAAMSPDFGRSGFPDGPQPGPPF